MALNPLDEIMNRQAPADLGGGGLPDMGGGPPGMGGGMPIPSGPAMGGGMPIDPAVGAEALDFAMGDPAMGMGDPAMGMDDMAMAAEGLGDLGGEASTDEAANQVANVIVEMAPSPDEAMNLANAISDKVADIVMGGDRAAYGGPMGNGTGDRLMELGMQFGGNVPPPRINPFTMPQQYGQQSWMGPQGQGGGRPMGPPVGGGYRDGGGIGSLMMQRGGEPTMAGGRPIQWQQGPVGQRRRQDFLNYMAPGQARRQLGRQQAAGGPGRAATSGIGMQQGGEPTMAGGRPIQWQQGPVGQRRRQDFMNYMAPGAARRQLGRQAAAGGPGRRAIRGAGGG